MKDLFCLFCDDLNDDVRSWAGSYVRSINEKWALLGFYFKDVFVGLEFDN